MSQLTDPVQGFSPGQSRLERKVRDSHNFFDLYEMALEQKKSTKCKLSTSTLRLSTTLDFEQLSSKPTRAWEQIRTGMVF